MRRIHEITMVAALAVAGLQIAGCQEVVGDQTKVEPAHVEHIEGSKLSSVTLTEDAMTRIDLQTVVVRETEVSGAEGGALVTRKVVPYSSLIYDPQGETWVYISPEPGKFVRHQVEVDRIEGDDVVLTSGPDKDTAIATVGAAELYGAESGVGH
jgi:hypothetical protein